MQEIKVRVTHTTAPAQEFTVCCRIDTPVEIEYYKNGGILHTVLRKMLAEAKR